MSSFLDAGQVGLRLELNIVESVESVIIFRVGVGHHWGISREISGFFKDYFVKYELKFL